MGRLALFIYENLHSFFCILKRVARSWNECVVLARITICGGHENRCFYSEKIFLFVLCMIKKSIFPGCRKFCFIAKRKALST